MILTAFHELQYYSKSHAYNFVQNVYAESTKHEIKSSEISSILEHLTKRFTKNEIEKDLERIEKLEEQMDNGENECQECGEFLYGEEDCKVCKQMEFMHGHLESD